MRHGPYNDAIIRPMRALSSYASLSLVGFLSSLVLGGCDFFGVAYPPPDGLEEQLVLRCGDRKTVDGLTGADSFWLDVSPQTDIDVRLLFDDPSLSARVTRIEDDRVVRALAVLTPDGASPMIWTARTDGSSELHLELLGTSSRFVGEVELECSQPAEVCFNLADDDGDGLADCFDPNCAWEPSCLEDQAPFETVQPSCGEGDLVINTTPTATESARNFYSSSGSMGEPLLFLGGAELAVTGLGEGVEFIELVAQQDGRVCLLGEGTDLDSGNALACDDWGDVGQTAVTLSPSEVPALIEPTANSGWTDLQVLVHCGTDN